MPTLVANTGFEHGVLSTDKSTGATRSLFTSVVGTPTVEAGAARTGNYGLRSASGANSATPAAEASVAVSVGRFYFRFDGAPSTTVRFANIGFELHLLTNREVRIGASFATGIILDVDTWHMIEWSHVDSTNVVKVRINGTAVTDQSSANTPQPPHLGQNAATGVTFDFDDVAVSHTEGDYPLGPGYSEAILPSSLAVNTGGTYVQDASGTAITTGDWARLDSVPIDETTDYIRQTAGNNTPSTNPSLGFANANTDDINGVQAHVAYGAAATQANAQRYYVTANGVDTYLHGTSSTQPTVGVVGPVYSSKQVDNGGVAWTDSMLDGLVFRWGTGTATDVNPVPRVNNMLIEVDYAESTGTPIGDELALQWGVRQPVGDPLVLQWNLKFALGDPLALQWGVRSTLGDPLALQWGVRTPANDSLALQWNVRAALGDPLALQWNVRAALGDPLVLLWDVDIMTTAVGKGLAVAWDTRAALGDPLSLVWNTRAALGDPLALQWGVRTSLGDPLALQWNVRAALGDPLALVWHTRALLGDPLALIWDVLGATTTAGKALGILWDTRATVSDLTSLQWGVRTAVGDPSALLWQVRAALGDPLVLLWDVEEASGFEPAAGWLILWLS
jgi:hypothetical protein